MFVGLNYENAKTATTLVEPGYATRVNLRLRGAKTLHSALTLRGWRCSTTVSLRFSYGSKTVLSKQYTTEQFKKLGTVTATLPSARTTAFPGYMLFTGQAFWKVSVFQKGRLLGSLFVKTVTV